MKNRTPTPRDQRPPIPAFDAVTRKTTRHDGWSPERQRAFIAALADTGSVQTACNMVNMSTEGAYYLRRQPGADGFRAAWEAALDMGVLRLRDEAFERAMNGQLVPVFVAGRLMGFRRKKNDRLLMFCLRHYGADAGRGTTRVDYFRRRSESEGPGEITHRQDEERLHLSGPATPAPAIPSRTDQADAAAATLAAFEGVPLDDAAQAAIVAALTENAARRRTLAITEDPETHWVPAAEAGFGDCGELESGAARVPERFNPEEPDWTKLDDEAGLAEIDAAVERMKAVMAERAALPAPDRDSPLIDDPSQPIPRKRRPRRPAS